MPFSVFFWIILFATNTSCFVCL